MIAGNSSFVVLLDDPRKFIVMSGLCTPSWMSTVDDSHFQTLLYFIVVTELTER